MGFIDSIEKVTEAKWYKLMMPKLYGWGAAIVILGALFKIEHLPGASYMLMAGLGMEAIIFFFSAFEKAPDPEPDWALVYPELAYMEDPDAVKRPSQQLDAALERAKIDNELIESLNANELVAYVSAKVNTIEVEQLLKLFLMFRAELNVCLRVHQIQAL